MITFNQKQKIKKFLSLNNKRFKKNNNRRLKEKNRRKI